MTREGWRLTEDQWREWLDSLVRAGKRVIAPVAPLAGTRALRLFQPVPSADGVALDGYGNTRWSPKEFLFPNTETLFSYSFRGEDVQLEGPRTDEQEQVLFGVRPCDAAGLSRLDDVFLGGEDEDPFHADRRRRTTTISLACDSARPQCFCTAVGGSPSGAEGSDLQLAPLDDAWLLHAVTEKGRNLIGDSAAGWTAASEADWASADETRRAVERDIKHNPVPEEWAKALESTFGDSVWDTLGERCLSCGICAYVCPSCSCFDVTDDGNAFCGTRCRTWDSCTFAGFTSHASGHNPRGDQPARYRQRVMHKFAYFPLQQGESFMCVGCGRCTALCPVGIDIQHSLRSAVAAGAAREGAS